MEPCAKMLISSLPYSSERFRYWTKDESVGAIPASQWRGSLASTCRASKVVFLAGSGNARATNQLSLITSDFPFHKATGDLLTMPYPSWVPSGRSVGRLARKQEQVAVNLPTQLSSVYQLRIGNIKVATGHCKL